MTHWPQWTWVVISAFALTIVVANDGKPREPYSAGSAFVSLLISVFILYWGGFFAPIGWGP